MDKWIYIAGQLVFFKWNIHHDRFLVIDNTVYHIGASLKDLGKKLFAFSKMEITHTELFSMGKV